MTSEQIVVIIGTVLGSSALFQFLKDFVTAKFKKSESSELTMKTLMEAFTERLSQKDEVISKAMIDQVNFFRMEIDETKRQLEDNNIKLSKNEQMFNEKTESLVKQIDQLKQEILSLKEERLFVEHKHKDEILKKNQEIARMSMNIGILEKENKILKDTIVSLDPSFNLSAWPATNILELSKEDPEDTLDMEHDDGYPPRR